MLWLLCLCVGLLAGEAGAEVFTAMADMEALLGAEKQVTTVIDEYIAFEMKRLDRLQNFAREYQKRNADTLKGGADFVANPVNAYLLIKRLTTDWSYVEDLMRNNLAEDFLKNITQQRESALVKFPDQEDLNGAGIALLRLQDTYRLSTADIANGRIQGVASSEELQAHDCFELGRIAYNQADYYHTVLWMTESMNRLPHEDSPTVEESDILEYLAFGLYQQGNVKRALKMTKRLYAIFPEHPRAHGNIKFYEDELIAQGSKKGDMSDLPPMVNERPGDNGIPERDMYEALCRGEKFLSDKSTGRLYSYWKRDTPFLWLAPVKVTILHADPLIVRLVNVISDYEVASIKELATPRLARATVHNKATGQLEYASYRISKSAWLKNEDHPVVRRVVQRIEDFTNLNMGTAEDLQIANYGLGGHYDPHFDFARIANYGLGGHYEPHFDMSTKEETNAFKGLGTGNRIATVLFYMHVPDAGGATVFPELKVSVFPTHHDAVFWYNLYKNGEGDLRTRHAACPVLSGQKWVANKWIHERGQEWRRPCGKHVTDKEVRVADEPFHHGCPNTNYWE